MKKFIFSVGLIFFLIPYSAFPSKKSLKRTEDFVVLTGKDIPELIGSEVSQLRLYSCQEGQCSPIPLQIDKVDANGRYVFIQDNYNPKRDGTLLDDNDELCFMAGDAGDRLTFGWKPPLATKGIEIELKDPLDHGRAWVYLFLEPGSDPPKVPDYVDYRKEGDRIYIVSSQFILSWKNGKINYDLMQSLAGPTKLGPDLLDLQRVGMSASLAKNDLVLSVPDSLIKTVDVAVTDGPVRVIVAQVMMLYFGEFQFQWGSEYFLRYYRCGQNNLVIYRLPSAAKSLFKSMTIYWSLDFAPEILGSTYLDANHPQALVITPGTVKGVPNDMPHYWWGAYGKNGALLQALKLDEETLDFCICQGLWNQNSHARDKKGDYPGKIEIGFSCRVSTEKTPEKTFRFLNYILFPAKPTASGITALQNLVESPLMVSAQGCLTN